MARGVSMASMAPIGPGILGMGVKSTLVDQAAWASGATANLYLDKGTQGGTLLGHRLQLLIFFSVTGATIGFTDEELRTAKDGIVANLKVSSKLGPMVTSQSTGITGGDIDLMNRAILRQKAGGSLDLYNGVFTFGNTGVIVHETPLMHYNPITGLNHCPDLSYFKNLQLQVTAGSTFSLGGTTFTITRAQWDLWCDYIPGRPGADSHLRWDQLLQSSETDTLPAQKRLGHLVTGSNAPTYASAIAALDNGSAISPSTSTYLYKVGGRDPYDTDGYLNNALVWSEAIRRSLRGSVAMPGADRYGVEAGLGSYVMAPLFIPSFEAQNDYMEGEVVIQNASNLAATSRTHSTIIVQRAGV